MKDKKKETGFSMNPPRAWHKVHKEIYDVLRLSWNLSDSKLIITLLNGDGYTLKEVVLLMPTGLLDKNGKEIYEGDVCRQTFNHKTNIGKVRISPAQGCLVGLYPLWPHDIEVIGNIYENPELLKDKK